MRLVAGLRFGQGRLTVADNGKGMEAEAGESGGSGRKLVASLARQIGGAIKYESTGQGTAMILTFPIVA